MPNRMMDYMMMRDMARGGGRGDSARGRRGRRGRRRGDRGMDYEYDMNRGYGDMERGDRAGDYGRGRDYGDYEGGDMARGGRGRGRDRGQDYGDYADMARGGRGDGHYPMMGGQMYYPMEAMGRFTGYYGMGEEDFARGGRGGDRGYDFGYGGDYGEGLTKKELEEWKMELMREVEEKDKHFFSKENIEQKGRSLGAKMKDYSEEELCLVTLMMYTDYCKTIKKYAGMNMDIYIELAKDWLEDEDSELKGSERLAVYKDCIVDGEE